MKRGVHLIVVKPTNTKFNKIPLKLANKETLEAYYNDETNKKKLHQTIGEGNGVEIPLLAFPTLPWAENVPKKEPQPSNMLQWVTKNHKLESRGTSPCEN